MHPLRADGLRRKRLDDFVGASLRLTETGLVVAELALLAMAALIFVVE
jgi:hypothetical protein